MAKWARIQDGKVVETTDIDPAGRFHSSLVWVGCDETVDQHYTYDGKKFTAPPPPPETTAADLAPGGTLDGLTAEEVQAFEDLAATINSNAAALRAATSTEVTNV